MDPFWSRYSIAPTYSFRLHFQHTLNWEKQGRFRINFAAHQEKKENDNAGEREAGRGKKQLIDFRGNR